MKRLFGFCLLLCLTWACEEDLPAPFIEQRFTSTILDCGFGGPNAHCDQFLLLKADGQADFQLDGNDNTLQGTYEIGAETIRLYTNTDRWGTVIFDIEDDVTLRRRPSGNVWTLDPVEN